MMQPAPDSPKKDKTWIVILAVLAGILLLCLVLVVGAVSYGVWRGYVVIPGVNSRTLPGFTLPTVPNQNGRPNPAPQGTPGPLTVEPYKPQPNDQYPSLQQLAPNWQNPTGPTTNTYNVTVPTNQPVLLASGWCTSTQPILDQNFQHIQYLISVDGKDLSTSNLYQGNQLANGQVCKDFAGIIRTWPAGNHTIKITMRLDAKINDGWNDFAAGDYVEIYNISVP